MSSHVPTVRELLVFHYECLQGMCFSEHRQVDGGAVLFSSLIKDPYYNFFSPGRPPSRPRIQGTTRTIHTDRLIPPTPSVLMHLLILLYPGIRSTTCWRRFMERR